VAALGLALSLWLAHLQRKSSDTLAHIRFTEEVRSSGEAIAQRLNAYTEVVNGLRDLFLLKPDLSRYEFDRIVAERNLQQHYPEIKNLSFARWVALRQLNAFEDRRRAQVPAGEVFHPVHPASWRSDYYVNEYVWPMEGNQGVPGLDISAQPANLEAQLVARGTGRTTLSAPFTLIQEKDLPTGIVLRAPVFKLGNATDRSENFIGTAAVSIRAADMVRAVQANGFLRDIVVRIDDMGPMSQPPARPQMLTEPPQWPAGTGLQETLDLQLHGRHWHLTFRPAGSALSATEKFASYWIAGMGAAISLLLAALVTLLVRLRVQALQEVEISHEALQQSEESLRAIFNQATVGIAHVHTPSGRLERLNERYCAILGYTAEELYGMSFMDVTHAEDLPEDLEQLQRLKAGEISEYRLDKRLIRKDGQVVWVDLRVSPLWKPGQDCNHHLAIVQDITDRKRMQDSLRDNERYLRSILQRLPVGLSILSQDGRFTFRNELNVQICGYRVEDMPDIDTWWQQAYPDPQVRTRIREEWLASLEQARQGSGYIPAGEYEIRCRDGQMKLLEIAGMMLGDDCLVTMVDLSQRKAAEDKIRHLAYYDPLTQLPNRRMLRDHLQQVLDDHARKHQCGALLLLDIDNFKTLNDTRGHDQGDALLCEVASRLRNGAAGRHMVARLGGDEFVVVLEGLADNPEQAQALARKKGSRILAMLREPYLREGEPFHATASIGVTIFEGAQEQISDLLKRADLAMYQAKATGRNALEFYDPQVQALVRARARLGADMRAGIAGGQFALFYQPQVEENTVTGCEALLRWRHPRDGYVSPAVFIPLAEETGLILPLGEWVLQTACWQLATWAQDPRLAHLTLAVNVSPRQFRQAGFVGQVLSALASAGAQPRKLKLELTEGLLLDNIEDTIQKMSELKAHGVGFALDDFGTGYSSLSYLKRLPLDQLKIDQSFVRDVLTDPNDAAIACTIVALGTSLGLQVIAEGVETEEQRMFLQAHNCHAWQGYLLSPPVSEECLAAMPLTYGLHAPAPMLECKPG
jgi:diguanylate cyclase (GGDEF)-like protein/PAS domain S-box-containing protein